MVVIPCALGCCAKAFITNVEEAKKLQKLVHNLMLAKVLREKPSPNPPIDRTFLGV
jgi:hypothetical protein